MNPENPENPENAPEKGIYRYPSLFQTMAKNNLLP
jgi:hypothetical protein